MSNVEQYHSEDRRDVLGDRGHRYKRNTLGLSAAAIVVALPGVTIDTAALPGVINVEPMSFWILYLGVLAYNFGHWLHHVNQDKLLFLADFEQVHRGHRNTLESGDEEIFDPPEGSGHQKYKATRISNQRRWRVDLSYQPPDSVAWNAAGSGLFISETDLDHVIRKERHFLWWEQRIPLALCVTAFFMIGLQVLNAIVTPA